MKHFTFLFILLSLLSCNKTEKKTIEQDIDIEKIDSLKIAKKDMDKIQYTDFGIDSKAKVTLDSWQAYNDIARAINELKQADFTFFTVDKSVFSSTIQEMETTVPKEIDSDAVRARILVLKTKLYKLEEAANIDNTKKTDKLLIVKDVFQAFSNLTFQINKKFEKEAQTIIKPEINEEN